MFLTVSRVIQLSYFTMTPVARGRLGGMRVGRRSLREL